MTLPEDRQPQLRDAVLGGEQQSPPIDTPVLGGAAGLPQYFPHLSVAEQQASILTLLDCGAAGLRQLIDCLRSPSRQLRQAAYDLLQMHPDAAAQLAIEPGFPLYPGESVYQVYESQFFYNDDRYELNTDFWRANMEEQPIPLIAQYLDFDQAKIVCNRLHQDLAVRDFQRAFPYFLDTETPQFAGCAYGNFPLLEWCKANKIPLHWPDETPEQYESKFWRILPEGTVNQSLSDFFLQEWQRQASGNLNQWERQADLAQRTVAFLVAAQWHDQIAELWCETIGSLAFIHEQVIRQTTYYDFHPDGSIVVVKN